MNNNSDELSLNNYNHISDNNNNQNQDEDNKVIIFTLKNDIIELKEKLKKVNQTLYQSEIDLADHLNIYKETVPKRIRLIESKIQLIKTQIQEIEQSSKIHDQSGSINITYENIRNEMELEFVKLSQDIDQYNEYLIKEIENTKQSIEIEKQRVSDIERMNQGIKQDLKTGYQHLTDKTNEIKSRNQINRQLLEYLLMLPEVRNHLYPTSKDQSLDVYNLMYILQYLMNHAYSFQQKSKKLNENEQIDSTTTYKYKRQQEEDFSNFIDLEDLQLSLNNNNSNNNNVNNSVKINNNNNNNNAIDDDGNENDNQLFYNEILLLRKMGLIEYYKFSKKKFKLVDLSHIE
ncbi:hypothetical protein CYY_004592 [Polysphondylium violaceum]|uniref:Uncharacterized protein n=1 Tax=Polysphondylium violaceum TaxID=133409 RepID=A0A8J4PUX6_9MYCE|nr:hypothetical protein CYY_004592 [Polysphondylium violaceum]